MTDLSDFVGSLRREVTPLGTTTFASVSDTDLTQHLVDAFWEAKLDGFMSGYTVDEDGVSTPDLPRQDVSLVVLYAGIKVLRNQALNTKTVFRAQAGPVQFEQQSSAMVITEMLRELMAIKQRILDQNMVTTVEVIDAFSARVFTPGLYTGSPWLAVGDGS